MAKVHEAQRDDTVLPAAPEEAGVSGGWLVFAKTKPLVVNALLFVAGYYLMPNGWVQQCSLLGLLLLQACWLKFPDLACGLREDRWVRAVFVFLAAGVLVSLMVNPAEASLYPVLNWVQGGALLGLFVLMMWQVGHDIQAAQLMGKVVAGAGAIAAVGSVVVFYFLSADGLIGDRLQNWFVYGGLHPVCAGLMWGFAATWAACRWSAAEMPTERRWWLVVLIVLLGATMLTLSRGAFLSLGVAHAVMLVVRGQSRALKACALLAGVMIVFQLGAPLLTKLADLQEHFKRGSITGRDHVRADLGDVVVTHNPAKELYQRGDNGRLQLYQHVLATMKGPADLILGKGLWASDREWQAGMSWVPEHMHSVFLSTFYHNGAIGLLALVWLLGWGMWRCLLAARRGQDLWIILASYGVMAVTFDGHSMQTLNSVPRFEALLLWLPLAMGCAASSRAKA